MRRAFGRVAVASIALSLDLTPVSAENAVELLLQYGLIGMRAINCAKPPGIDNPYTVFRIEPDGTIKWDLVGERSRVIATVTIVAVEELEKNYVRISQAGAPGENVRIEYDVRVDGNRVRAFRSVGGDGRTYIEAGRLTANSKETPWLIKCQPTG